MLIIVAVLLTLVILFTDATWARTVTSASLALSGLTLLAMTLYTLPREEAYDWNADLSVLPTAIRWPVQVGTWAGQAAVLLVVLLIALTSMGHSPEGGSRFAISMVAVFGAVATIYAFGAGSLAVSAFVLYGIIALWCAVVLVALLRGIYGLLAKLVR